jgi:hypothetical protein
MFTSNVASFTPDGNAFVILDRAVQQTRALIQMPQSALSTAIKPCAQFTKFVSCNDSSKQLVTKPNPTRIMDGIVLSRAPLSEKGTETSLHCFTSACFSSIIALQTVSFHYQSSCSKSSNVNEPTGSNRISVARVEFCSRSATTEKMLDPPSNFHSTRPPKFLRHSVCTFASLVALQCNTSVTFIESHASRWTLKMLATSIALVYIAELITARICFVYAAFIFLRFGPN